MSAAMDINPRIHMGANGGPPLDPVADPVAAAFAKIDDLYGEARLWADGESITSEEMHDAISTLYEQLHDAGKEADELRVAQKKPLDEQIDAIQRVFNPYVQPKKGKVALGKEALGALLSAWRTKVQREAAEKAERARQEAAELAAQAQAEMRASSGNLEARERAEETVKFAKDADRYARRQEKAATTGTGLRAVWSAELTDLGLALDWAYTAHQASFQDFVQGLADTAVRAGARSVPGFAVTESKVAI